MVYLTDVPLGKDHPLALELTGLRTAVARFQDEAHTASVKLQRHSLETTRAHDRSQHLERENAALKAELAVLRANPHPDVSNGTLNAKAASQVQQLTLSLRRLSDQLSLTEEKLATRTAEFTHAKSDVAKAKLTAESAYELAARIRGREEAGKVRERELEWEVRAAQEESKMSDLAVREYADLTRSLELRLTNSAERPSINEQAPPPVPEKDASSTSGSKMGVDFRLEREYNSKRLLTDLRKDMEELQAQLDRIQADLTASESKLEAERKAAELDRTERARVEFELERMRTDDTTAAKMVSRYMKFSQTSNDTLQTSLCALQARHAATLDALHSQIYSLSSELHTAESQNEHLRSALDELGGEMMKEMYGRRIEVALRIRMLNREEKIQEGLKRWLRKMEEAVSRSLQTPNSSSSPSSISASNESQAGAHDLLLASSQDARILLTILEDGPVTDDGTLSSSLARIIMAQNTIDQLVEELTGETQRRLELERLLPLAGQTPASACAIPIHDDVVGSPSESINSTDKVHTNINGLDPPVIDINPKLKPPSLPLPDMKVTISPESPALFTGATVQAPLAPLEGHVADFEALEIGENELVDGSLSSALHGEMVAEQTEQGTPIAEIPGDIEGHQHQNEGEDENKRTTTTLIPANAIASESAVNSVAVSDASPPPLTCGSLQANDPHNPNPISAEDDDHGDDKPTEVQAEVDIHRPLPIEVSIPDSGLSKDPAFVHIPEVQGYASSLFTTSAQNVGTTCAATSSNVQPSHVTLASPSDFDKRLVGNENVAGNAIFGAPGDSVHDSGICAAPSLDTNGGSLDQASADVSNDLKGSIPHDINLHREDHKVSVSNIGGGSTGRTNSTHFESEKEVEVELLNEPPVVSTPHPLLAELSRVSKRYDELQRAFRDCHLALETLKASLPSRASSGTSQQNVVQFSESSSKIPPEVLHSALQRLDDFTEDARVELEIKTSDERLLARGYETLLFVPGALSSSSDLSSIEDGHDRDSMPTQSETELQILAFISGTDINVKKNQETFARKLQDVQHDIAALKQALHEPEIITPSLTLSATPSNGGGWTSWIRSPSSSSSLGTPRSASAALSPTFGNIMTSPRLRQSPSMNFPQKNVGVDPLASLGLRIPMPKFSVAPGTGLGEQAQQPSTKRVRTVSTMYMLGLGAPPGMSPRIASGGTLGLRDITSPTKMRPMVVSTPRVGDDESEVETDAETSDDGDNTDVE